MSQRAGQQVGRNGWLRTAARVSLPEVHASVPVARAGGFWRTMAAFAGPGLLVSVGYMDPGNWATDLAGGARFGYALLSVILLSNGMAILLQHLSVKLGVVAERDLAQACRDSSGRAWGFAQWGLCEVAIAACDMAEVIGSAIALNLLFGIPLVVGVLITVFDVMVVLLLQSRGFRILECIVGGLVATIGACFAYELVVSNPAWSAVVGGLLPTPAIVTDPSMLYIAIGILGATVMPHNLYLHSSVVQTRAYERTEEGKARAVRFATIDSTVSLLFAFLINAAILVLAAAVFHGTEHADVADISDAYRLLSPALGIPAASTLFAVALLASGQASTLTGTLAGQIVMEGFLDLRLKPWMRRLVTRLVAVVPAVIVAALAGEQGVGKLLILSQVILSMQLGFAVVPLVRYTSDRAKMGRFANGPTLAAIAWTIAAVIVGLNVYLLAQTAREWLAA
jgi:manganese transport protein